MRPIAPGPFVRSCGMTRTRQKSDGGHRRWRSKLKPSSPLHMHERKGIWGSEQVSDPISLSDIRKWAIAVYWPKTPPRLFWDAEYASDHALGRDHRAAGFQPLRLADQVRGPRGRERSRRVEASAREDAGMNGGQVDTYFAPMRPGDVIRARHPPARLGREQNPPGPHPVQLHRNRVAEPERRNW